MAANVVPLSLRTLLAKVQRTAALETVLTFFQGLGFRSTSWIAGGIGRSTAEFLADWVATKSELVYLIASSGFLDWATGGWLTILAYNVFDQVRAPATYATGEVSVSVEAGKTPWTITPGGAIFRTETDLRYYSTNPSNIVVAAGGSQPVPVKAESPGDAYNVGAGTIVLLVTTHPGASVTNQSSWQSSGSLGVDEQSDASLRQACRDKWGRLTANPPAEAYRSYAVEASALVTRAWVDADNPFGPGTVGIYLAGPNGAVTTTEIAEVVAVLAVRRGLCAIVTVLSATNRTCELLGTVYVAEGYSVSDVQSAVEAAIVEYFQSLDIGGDTVGGSSKVWDALLRKAIQSVPGVALAQLTSGDFAMLKTEVPVPDYSSLSYLAA